MAVVRHDVVKRGEWCGGGGGVEIIAVKQLWADVETVDVHMA